MRSFFCAAAHPGAALWKKWQLLPVGPPKYAGAGQKKEGPGWAPLSVRLLRVWSIF